MGRKMWFQAAFSTIVCSFIGALAALVVYSLFT